MHSRVPLDRLCLIGGLTGALAGGTSRARRGSLRTGPNGKRLAEQYLVELGPRADVQLHVIIDCARAEEQRSRDLRFRFPARCDRRGLRSSYRVR
jgi:hypothetical protein